MTATQTQTIDFAPVITALLNLPERQPMNFWLATDGPRSGSVLMNTGTPAHTVLTRGFYEAEFPELLMNDFDFWGMVNAGQAPAEINAEIHARAGRLAERCQRI